jgi:hypothetical protein
MLSQPVRRWTNKFHCLAGGGEMGALMRSMDWSKTPVGPVESWSPALGMVVRLLLANRFPLLLWWGPWYCQFYNDPYRPVLGTKHPRSMGQPASEWFPRDLAHHRTADRITFQGWPRHMDGRQSALKTTVMGTAIEVDVPPRRKCPAFGRKFRFEVPR